MYPRDTPGEKALCKLLKLFTSLGFLGLLGFPSHS